MTRYWIRHLILSKERKKKRKNLTKEGRGAGRKNERETKENTRGKKKEKRCSINKWRHRTNEQHTLQWHPLRPSPITTTTATTTPRFPLLFLLSLLLYPLSLPPSEVLQRFGVSETTQCIHPTVYPKTSFFHLFIFFFFPPSIYLSIYFAARLFFFKFIIYN